MSARLLEAIQRGLWEQPSAETRRALEAQFLSAEAALEARAEEASPPQAAQPGTAAPGRPRRA
jgi:cobalamin biosynthesis Mg chelatase CobN